MQTTEVTSTETTTQAIITSTTPLWEDETTVSFSSEIPIETFATSSSPWWTPVESTVVSSTEMPTGTITTSNIFYPFGENQGDIINPRSDDGGSSAIYLYVPFPFFGNIYTTVFVNNNGFITFNYGSGQYYPNMFPSYSGMDIIAPFWTDIDNRNNGVISYQQYTDPLTLQQATEDVRQYFPGNFTATLVFVATWDRVPYYPVTSTESTFQAVLITNGESSYIIFNYGPLTPRYNVQAGYNSMTGAHYFSIPGSFTYNINMLQSTSNINVMGRWAFYTGSATNGCMVDGHLQPINFVSWMDNACQNRCQCMNDGTLQCWSQPCSFNEVCQPSDQYYTCQYIPISTCIVTGDPHYYTFDGRLFHFQGTCTYVLSQLCNNGGNLMYYRVEAKNENRGNSLVAWTRLVRVIAYEQEIELIKEYPGQAMVNDHLVAVPISLLNGKIRVYQTGFSLAITTDFGLTVTYDMYSYVTVNVPNSYNNATCGLCGTLNSNQADDFLTSEGLVVSSDIEFGNSWKVADNDSNCHGPCTDRACLVCQPYQEAQFSSSSYCGLMRDVQGPFNACIQLLPPENFIESCVYDLCTTSGYQMVLCQALHGYSAQCQRIGGQPGQWRTPGFCEMSCPPNSHYEECGTACPATCTDPSAPSHCTSPCMESCICNPGYVLSVGDCVPLYQCGCTFEGRYYAEGAQVILDEDCGRSCMCSQSTMQCVQNSCGAQEECRLEAGVRACYPQAYGTCWIEGSLRYRTFDGLNLEYAAGCQLILVKLRNMTTLPNFVVSVQKVPTGDSGSSFTSLLHLEAYATLVTIATGDIITAQVNGQYVSLPYNSDRIQVFFTGISQVTIQTDFGVTIRVDWPHLLTVTVPSTYSGALVGICGNFNFDVTDEFQTPDGLLVSDAQTFGDSWRDGSLSDNCVENRHSLLNCTQEGDEVYSSDQYCGIISLPSGPFQACHSVINPLEYITNCVSDMCHLQGSTTVLCEVIRNYAKECQRMGVAISEWRNLTSCDLTCPPNSHYELCGSSCPATCPSLSFPFPCQTPCEEGCICDNGYILSGPRCVLPTECGCFYQGQYYSPGESFWQGAGCQTSCTCDGNTGVVQCFSASCGPQESCEITNGVYGCQPNYQGLCIAAGDPHYYTFDGNAYDFQGTCRYVLAQLCNESLSLESFRVEGKNRRWYDSYASITSEVFVYVYGQMIHFSGDYNYMVQVDDINTNVPAYLGNGQIMLYQSGSYSTLQTDFGLTVTYDGYSVVTITLPSRYRGATCGLCGNFNGQPYDDFITRSGILASDILQFASDWQIQTNESCCNNCDYSQMCPDESLYRSPNYCGMMADPNGPFRICQQVVDPQLYINNCVYDLCSSGQNSEMFCQAILSYSGACQVANARVLPWRNGTVCQMECPENSHYELCGTECDQTCSPSIFSYCDQTCSEGCFCDENYQRSGSQCVPIEQCGCLYDGVYYMIDELRWAPDCSQKCQCTVNGNFECVAVSCNTNQQCTVRNGQRGCYDQMSTCTVMGDPHYFTFDGQVVNFQGTCAYEISRTSGNSSNFTFRVVAENRNRGSALVSFVSAVNIWLSNEMENVYISIGPNNFVQINGIPTSIPAVISSFATAFLDNRFVVVNTSKNMEVRFDGSGNLLVRVGQQYMNILEGMCGNFNGDPTDDRVLPTGEQTSSDFEFGTAWKSDISQQGCQEQNDTSFTCDNQAEYESLCSIITNSTGPFAVCQSFVNPQNYFDACLYDLCMYSNYNRMICSAVASYEAACNIQGLQIPAWQPFVDCYESDPCEQLHCTEKEWCGERDGVFGCFCYFHDVTLSENEYDFRDTCQGGSGSLSLSRCLLFEDGLVARDLHMNDPNCTGAIVDGRVEFNFDSLGNQCGTTLTMNSTHFVYRNSIVGSADDVYGAVISRAKQVNISFDCAYPIIEQASIFGLNPEQTVVYEELPGGEGHYQVMLVAYHDAQFQQPYSGGMLNVFLDEKVYVAANVFGVDETQFVSTLQSCWATPDTDPDSELRWDLIIHQCPNPLDGTVKIIQDGISTVSRFSFNMFRFKADSNHLYVHCNIQLCNFQFTSCTVRCPRRSPYRVSRSIKSARSVTHRLDVKESK
uniref:Alpha-tectorin-like n=1 Tax=Erpetoichthys calabaricus TaxID=27687 RepID=A0A8C4T620_ERPCA